MKLADAKDLINRKAGYRVHFEKRERGMLCSDYFPEFHEEAIDNVTEAWQLAEEFALVDPETYVNVYVISALTHVPVHDYVVRRLNTYPPRPQVGGM